MMQSSGRVLVSSARSSVLRLSRHNHSRGIRTFHSRPPPGILVSSLGVQRRGYRRTTVSLKEDDDKRSKTPKDVEKQSPEESDQQKSAVDRDSAVKDEDSKEKTVDAAKEKSVESESTGPKERRTRQKTSEERSQPAIISRNQALSLVTGGGGGKSRLIIANHEHPDVYPQCIALAMSGRPILPGFYSSVYFGT